MIFVTVGTHEQAFDRLLMEVDRLKLNNVIKEDLIVQTGVSMYEMKSDCLSRPSFSYEDMKRYTKEARIVITHGGPSSFMLAVGQGKVPIVVPRQAEMKEHVNNHQMVFCDAVSKEYKNIIVVKNITNLEKVITKYDSISGKMKINFKSHNAEFNAAFSDIVDGLMKE